MTDAARSSFYETSPFHRASTRTGTIGRQRVFPDLDIAEALDYDLRREYSEMPVARHPPAVHVTWSPKRPARFCAHIPLTVTHSSNRFPVLLAWSSIAFAAAATFERSQTLISGGLAGAGVLLAGNSKASTRKPRERIIWTQDNAREAMFRARSVVQDSTNGGSFLRRGRQLMTGCRF